VLRSRSSQQQLGETARIPSYGKRRRDGVTVSAGWRPEDGGDVGVLLPVLADSWGEGIAAGEWSWSVRAAAGVGVLGLPLQGIQGSTLTIQLILTPSSELFIIADSAVPDASKSSPITRQTKCHAGKKTLHQYRLRMGTPAIYQPGPPAWNPPGQATLVSTTRATTKLVALSGSPIPASTFAAPIAVLGRSLHRRGPLLTSDPI
jgi:hypothetical protein